MIFKRCLLTQAKVDRKQSYGDYEDTYKQSFTAIIVSDESIAELLKVHPSKYVKITVEEEDGRT